MTTTTFQTQREGLAWAAGFFDGEGHIAFRMSPNATARYRAIRIEIPQCDPAVLERFKDVVGGLGTVHGPYGPYGEATNSRPHWVFRVAGFPQVQSVVAAMWPFLGPVKRDQARKAILAYRAQGKQSLPLTPRKG